jgi:hypothetical protein
MKIVRVCPLGSKCEQMIDSDTMERCGWYIQLSGQNPQTGEQMDEWGCSMAWLPVLLVENARASSGTSVAVETFRNEMVAAGQVSVAEQARKMVQDAIEKTHAMKSINGD